MVAAIGIVQILAWGSSYYLLAILAAPISRDTGWPYAWVIGGVSVGLLVAGLVSVRVGRTIEAQGGRPVLAAAAMLLALGLGLLGSARSLPLYFLSWSVIGAGMGAGLYDAAFATLGRLYGLAARRAITTLTLWGGFASTVCWPLSAWLVGELGWRGACLAYAGTHLVVTLPLVLVGIPAAPPAQRASAAEQAPGVSLPTGRHLLVGLLAAILTAAAAIAAICSVHLITMLEAGGLSLAAAVALGALIGPAQVGARVVEFATGGRHHPIWTMTIAAVLIASGLALLSAGIRTTALALIAYGAGNGLWSIARGALPLTLFGAAGYAALMGRLALPSLLAQALAPTIGALMMARLGASATITSLAILALGNLAAVGALWWLSAARVPRTDAAGD